MFTIIVFVAYLVERAFSAVIMLLDNKRNRLDIVKRGNLCFFEMFLTKMKPDIDKLIAVQQPHPSH